MINTCKLAIQFKQSLKFILANLRLFEKEEYRIFRRNFLKKSILIVK